MRHDATAAPPTRPAAPRRRGRGDARPSCPRSPSDVVAAIVDEVPSYRDAFAGPMGETIRNAVQLALGGFLSLASGGRAEDLRTPTAPAVEGAYQLGRGEARSGRTTDALLAAYRIGARVVVARAVDHRGPQRAAAPTCWPTSPSWSSPTSTSCRRPRSPATPTRPRRPGGSGSGCSSGIAAPAARRRPRRGGASRPPSGPAGTPPDHADRRTRARVAGPPGARPGLRRAPSRPTTRPGWTRACCCSSPTRTVAGVRRCCGRCATARSIAGPAVPWLEVRRLGRPGAAGPRSSASSSTPRRTCPGWCCTPTSPRSPTCAPGSSRRSTGCGPATAEKLADTLRAWLLHQGRRDDVAAALFVHPQTVRYRMGQLRDLYGDRLEDPETVLALTIALA